MLVLRSASKEDFEVYLALKSEDSAVYWGGFSKAPDEGEFRVYYDNTISCAGELLNRKIYIIEDDGIAVGYFDIIPFKEEVGVFRTSIGIFEKYRGHGYAKKAIPLMLKEAKTIGLKKHRATIREDNIASLKSFEANGYIMTGEYETVFIPSLQKEIKKFFLEKEL